MIKIYTSYYARVKDYTGNALLVTVSNTYPNWFSKRLIKLQSKVCPDWADINPYKNGEISYEDFCNRYISSLCRRITPKEVVIEIEDLCYEMECDEVILLCWEKSGCHRTALGMWLREAGLNYVGELT